MALARRRIFDKARFGKTRLTRTGATTMPFGAWLGLGVAASALVTLLARARRANGQVGDLMVRDVVTIDTASTLFDAAQRMRDANVGVLPVLEAALRRGDRSSPGGTPECRGRRRRRARTARRRRVAVHGPSTRRQRARGPGSTRRNRSALAAPGS